MASDQNDKLMRAYARLRALRENLPQQFRVDKVYVDQFHEAIQHLQDSDIDVEEFQIRREHLVRTAIGKDRNTGELQYSTPRIDRALLLAKIDAVIGYFELATQRRPRPLALNHPQRRMVTPEEAPWIAA